MINWKFRYDIGDTEKLVKQMGERGKRGEWERRAYGVSCTGELSAVVRLYSSGTGDKVADVGALWNLREQGLFEALCVRRGCPGLQEEDLR